MAAQKSTSIPPPWYKLEHTLNGEPYSFLPTASSVPIYLTTLYSTDAAAMQAVLSIPSINDALLSVPKPYTLSNAKIWINEIAPKSCFAMQILRAKDPISGPLVGGVSLTFPDAEILAKLGPKEDFLDGESNLGYYLHPDYRGKGIVAAAVQALITWAEKECGVRRVVVGVAEDNEGSMNVAQKLEGFEVVEKINTVRWPENKGGDLKVVRSWRWTSKTEV
ncbi:hypothetical protein B7494_g4864 [Chlorociboria aeruginascens]|nr:hypothetical protein B7494_g4864 [Chlorociboria aeruginascens]